jgi:PAS domain-containing protein
MDARALRDDIIDALLTDLDDATMRAQDRSIEAFRMAVAANCVFCAVSGCRWRFAGIPSAGPRYRKNFAKLHEANERLSESERRLKDFAAAGAHQFREADEERRFTRIEAAGRNAWIKDKSIFLRKRRWKVAAKFGHTRGVDWEEQLRALDSHKWFGNFRYSVRFQDGFKVSWLVHAEPLFNAEGTFAGYRGTSREITAEAKRRLRRGKSSRCSLWASARVRARSERSEPACRDH